MNMLPAAASFLGILIDVNSLSPQVYLLHTLLLRFLYQISASVVLGKSSLTPKMSFLTLHPFILCWSTIFLAAAGHSVPYQAMNIARDTTPMISSSSISGPSPTPAATPATSSKASDPHHSSVSVLPIIGVLMAALAPVAIIGAIVFVGIKRRRQRDQRPKWQPPLEQYQRVDRESCFSLSTVDNLSHRNERIWGWMSDRGTESQRDSQYSEFSLGTQEQERKIAAPVVPPMARVSPVAHLHESSPGGQFAAFPRTSKWERLGRDHARARASEDSWPLREA